MTIWFRYWFRCPLCKEIVSSGDQLEFAPSREDIPDFVYGKHPKCPLCHKPLTRGEIELLITEVRKQ
jgi:hypothetical protein